MTTLPAVRAPLPVLVDEILHLTAKLHPDEALVRLGPLWAESETGMAQRALLAARIALMRKSITAAPLAVELPEPELMVEPVFIPAPLPKPAPLNRGALKLMNLEDAARMLMVAGDDTTDAPAALPDPADPGRTIAAADLAEVIADEASVAKGRAKKPKAKRIEGAAAKAAALDLAAQFADMAGDAPSVKAAPLDLAAQFADMADDAPAAKAAPLDLAAQFADMADDAPAVKAAPLDLAAQFEAMGWDPESEPAKTAPKGKAAGLAIDLSAQFAALGEE